MIKINLKLIGIVLIMLAGCNGGGAGITVPQSDSSPPTLTLGAGQPNGGSTTVNAGGSESSLTLTAKSGPLNLTATADDPESGIQSLQIWVNKISTSCDGDICSTSGPGLLTAPMFESTVPQKKPGEKTARSSILADALDLSTLIPSGSVAPGKSLTVEVIINAVAVNHLGGRIQTPDLKAVWKEP